MLSKEVFLLPKQRTKKNVSLFIVFVLFFTTLTSCGSTADNITEQLICACEEDDYETISKLAPEYIFSKPVGEKTTELNDSCLTEVMELSEFNDTIIWLYLISLIDVSQEVSSKKIFVDEFLKCEDYFMQKSPDCYLYMSNVVNVYLEEPEDLQFFTEALSMAILKSPNSHLFIPAIVALYGILDAEDENDYYNHVLLNLYNEKEFVIESNAKRKNGKEYMSLEEKKAIIEEYYSSITTVSTGYTTLSNTDILAYFEQITDDFDIGEISGLFNTIPVCRKDICVMYIENQQYRVCFYGCPFKVVGIESINTGELIAYKTFT